MEGNCSTAQSPQWAVVLMEEEIILSSVTCPAQPCFKHYPINGTLFGGKEILNIKCVF
jgi:hypothetical protein